MGDPRVSLLIPAKDSAHALERTTLEAFAFLEREAKNDFEIILIPTLSSQDATVALSHSLARQFPAQIRVAPHHSPVGKGAALKTGFLASRGRNIFFTDADLPYDLDFFSRALRYLDSGYGFITGNRRLPTSQFDIPVDLLSIAYKRHRLGLLFNRFVRFLLPIQTTDTQAGIKAIKRELAESAFSKMVCPGFFFDLEFFLTARGQGAPSAELPVTLYLNSEKSTVKVLRESLLALYWLGAITVKNWRGDYGKVEKTSSVLARYKKAPLKTRVFLALRWWLTPYAQMASQLPPQGDILDLGSGHGLFSICLALGSRARRVTALDHDASRIQLAEDASRGLSNLQIFPGSLLDRAKLPESGCYQGIALIDTMHYFNPLTQEEILKRQWDALSSGGTLIVREVDPHGGFISKWNRFYEQLATRSGFTHSRESQLYFKTQAEWHELLRAIGFRVNSFRCSSPIFSDILYVCRKP